MNSFIKARFDSYQQQLISSTAVLRYTVIKLNVTSSDGRVRVRARLIDGGLLEFAEYIEVDHNDVIITHSYAFHWQDAHNHLCQRWDNVNHFPSLPYAPHHIHRVDGSVEGNPTIPTGFLKANPSATNTTWGAHIYVRIIESRRVGVKGVGGDEF